jgi:hypothetical protein
MSIEMTTGVLSRERALDDELILLFQSRQSCDINPQSIIEALARKGTLSPTFEQRRSTKINGYKCPRRPREGLSHDAS